MTNPIIPWLGGKRRLADKLIPLFPQHECYVEVFCGGAALYFLRPVPAQTEVINDINGELVNLYRVVQHHLEEFVENLSWQDCMTRYDSSHTFFYCDPPYWQTEGYGVDFGFEQYQQMADFIRQCKGKVMVSINDHPAIRDVFNGLHMMGLDIKYSVANTHGQSETSKELVITNWEPKILDSLF